MSAPVFGMVSGPAANYVRAIQRMWGLRGDLGQMGNEVLPIFDPFQQREVLALAQIRLCIGGVAQSGGVGTNAKILLENPADSNVAIVPLGAIVIPVTTDDIEVRVGVTAVGTIQNVTQFADSRLGFGSTRVPVGRIRSTADAVTEGITVNVLRQLSGEPLWVPLPIVLAGDPVSGASTWVQFRMATANQNMRANFYWYERALSSDERTL